jgi:hypothetical protein
MAPPTGALATVLIYFGSFLALAIIAKLADEPEEPRPVAGPGANGVAARQAPAVSVGLLARRRPGLIGPRS